MSQLFAYYNYYIDSNSARALEIDHCFYSVIENPLITPVILLEPGIVSPHCGLHEISVSRRPTFADYFSAIDKFSGPDDINLILNSDCFIDPEDMHKLLTIARDEAWCISRIEISSASPLLVNRKATDRRIRKHKDMQDAWVFRGKPNKTMYLDYCMGKPGCDNRFAWELQNAGYKIADPFQSIRLYHYHRSNARSYQNVERVSQPYAFPPIVTLEK